MKLLLDNNLSYKLCKPLQKHFPLSEHVKTILTLDTEDIDIWNFAKENQYAIVTKDIDFNELSLLKGCPPKIIHLMCGNASTKAISELLVVSTDVVIKFEESDECVLKIFEEKT